MKRHHYLSIEYLIIENSKSTDTIESTDTTGATDTTDTANTTSPTDTSESTKATSNAESDSGGGHATGDDNMLPLYILLMTISISAAAIILRNKKRKI